MLYVDVSIDPLYLFKTFNELLRITFNKLKNLNNNIYITGDFNVNTLTSVQSSLDAQNVKNILSSNFIHPLINRPTKITSKTATLIDNIYGNIQEIGTKYDPHILWTISDRYAIFNKQTKYESEHNVVYVIRMYIFL